MVTYELVSRSGNVLTYSYWPEGKREYKPGTFVVDLDDETAELTEPAERDFRGRTDAAKLNEMRDSINAMRAERGEGPVPEDELPEVPDGYVEEWWQYYSHAIDDLSRRLDSGEGIERGGAAWY